MVARRAVLQSRVGTRGGLSSQDGVSHQQETDPLSLPQLNCLNESFLVGGEDASNVTVTHIPP
jgi:hypothetical protein